jgi:hypothetical protein
LSLLHRASRRVLFQSIATPRRLCLTLHLVPLWHLSQITLTLLPLPPPLLLHNNSNRHRLISNTSSCKVNSSSINLISNRPWHSSRFNSLLLFNMRFSRLCNSMLRLNLSSTPSELLLLVRAALSTHSLASG